MGIFLFVCENFLYQGSTHISLNIITIYHFLCFKFTNIELAFETLGAHTGPW